MVSDEAEGAPLMLLQKDFQVILKGHDVTDDSTTVVRPYNVSASFRQRATPTSGFTNYYQAAPQKATDSSARVLLFWPVGSSHRAMNLVKENVDHVHEQLTNADVFFVHYDLNKAAWLASNASWYEQNIAFSVEREGYKYQLLRALLFEEESVATPDLYSWVWCLDEDIDFHTMHLPRMFAIADSTGALITIPAFTQEEDEDHRDVDLDYPIQEPRAQCQYRYTPFVEVIFPLIRPIVLKLVLLECEHCVHENSFWGLDCVWCEWSANRLGSPSDTACAIIDETPAKHMNFKTMSSKYAGSAHSENQTFLDRGIQDREDVRKHHTDEYVDMKNKQDRWSYCVKS